MSHLRAERGTTAIIVSVSMVAIMGMAALAIDTGMLFQTRGRLQATADAAALAAAQEIPNLATATAVATQYVGLNEQNSEYVLDPSDVVLGNWDQDQTQFIPNGAPIDAVSVTVRRSSVNNNAVGLWFARVLGRDEADVDATAIALAAGGLGSRFLIDDEMIDSDIPVIEDLANLLGMDPIDLISDGDGDWFIDLPAGEVLELPTGQVGDEGMFDMAHPDFPFSTSSDPSFENFMNYNEDSNSWRYNEVPKEMLDPLVGVDRVDDRDEYPNYVDGNCQVSPVYKSDISALNPVGGSPAVNGLGLRRGLLAFKILAVGNDPDGVAGSVLPNLVIEVCPPVLDLSGVGPGATGGIQLVY